MQEIVAGKYVIEAKIGKGGFGRIYKARELISQQIVAIKVFNEENLEEIKLLSQCNHPNIIRYKTFEKIHYKVGLGETTEAYALILEFAPYGSLQDKIKENWSEKKLWVLIFQMASALDYLHCKRINGKKLGIVHRDIKPANILCFPNQCYKLSDFGISKQLKDFMAYTTRGGYTPFFAPPELFSGEYSSKSDIYSLLVTIYVLMMKKPPIYRANCTTEEMIELVLTVKPFIPTNVSLQLQSLFRRALSKEKEKRPSAKEILNIAIKKTKFFAHESVLDNSINKLNTPVTPPKIPKGKKQIEKVLGGEQNWIAKAYNDIKDFAVQLDTDVKVVYRKSSAKFTIKGKVFLTILVHKNHIRIVVQQPENEINSSLVPKSKQIQYKKAKGNLILFMDIKIETVDQVELSFPYIEQSFSQISKIY